MLRAACLALVLALAPGPAPAELDAEAYETEAGALTEAERAAMRARLAAEIAAEQARAEEARLAAAREAARIEAERAARPLGERLLEARCLTCHDAGQIDRIAQGSLGWTATVLRMEWLNGARLDAGERGAIVAHLAARHPGRSRAEWAAVIAAGVLAALVACGASLRRRAKRAARRQG